MAKRTSNGAVDPTNKNDQAQDAQETPSHNEKKWKERKLDAINESMRLNEEDLATSKAKVLRLQNRVSSLENKILTGIQEKAKILAEDDCDGSDAKQSANWRELQGRLKTLKDSLQENEEELATNKVELSRLQDRVTSLEYKIISQIQEKARINLMADDHDHDNEKHKDYSEAKVSAVAATKRQKVV